MSLSVERPLSIGGRQCLALIWMSSRALRWHNGGPRYRSEPARHQKIPPSPPRRRPSVRTHPDRRTLPRGNRRHLIQVCQPFFDKPVNRVKPSIADRVLFEERLVLRVWEFDERAIRQEPRCPTMCFRLDQGLYPPPPDQDCPSHFVDK